MTCTRSQSTYLPQGCIWYRQYADSPLPTWIPSISIRLYTCVLHGTTGRHAAASVVHVQRYTRYPRAQCAGCCATHIRPQQAALVRSRNYRNPDRLGAYQSTLHCNVAFRCRRAVTFGRIPRWRGLGAFTCKPWMRACALQVDFALHAAADAAHEVHCLSVSC